MVLLDSGIVWLFKKRNKKGSGLKTNVINCDTRASEGQSIVSMRKERKNRPRDIFDNGFLTVNRLQFELSKIEKILFQELSYLELS